MVSTAGTSCLLHFRPLRIMIVPPLPYRLNKRIIFLNRSFLNYLVTFCFLRVLQIPLIEAELDVREGSDDHKLTGKINCRDLYTPVHSGQRQFIAPLNLILFFD